MRPSALSLLLVFGVSVALHAQTLYNFESPATLTSSLVDGGDGFFYGTAERGGSAGKGIVYKVDLTTGQWTTVATFNGANGAYPIGDVLVQGQFLYGTTYQGGAHDTGTVYKIDRATGALTTLHHFEFNDGMYPEAGLVAYGSALYGTTSDGGEHGFGGSIFKIDPATGVLTSLVNFSNRSDFTGSKPISPLLVVGSVLYGTTHDGFQSLYKFDPASLKLTAVGSSGIGAASYSGLVSTGSALYGTSWLPTFPGSLFKVDLATGAVSTMYTFTATRDATTGSLIYDGTYLYGTAERSSLNFGSVFRFDPATNAVTTLATFNYENGSAPRAALLIKNGALYGTTSGGGPNNGGSIFKVDLSSGALTTLSFFNHDGTGATPSGAPFIDGSVLYGTALEGGSHALGTVYKMDLATGALSTLASFDFRSGGNPSSGVLLKDGKLYGTAESNGVDASGKFTNNGTVYSVDPSNGALAMVAAFDGSKNTGVVPHAALTSAGAYLYGTTVSSFTGNTKGTVFRVDPSTKALTILYTFTSPYPNGATPRSPLLLHGGALYGATYEGGSLGRGVVFKVDPSTGAVSAVTSLLTKAGDPANANSGLVALGGALYGASYMGGQYGKGAIFKVDLASGAVTTLASFNGPTGEYPMGDRLVTDGTSFFGTAVTGGAYGHGTVFQFSPATGKLSAILTFDIANGDTPFGGVVVDGQYLYGTTQYGGERGGGTLFRLAIPRPKTRAIGRR